MIRSTREYVPGWTHRKLGEPQEFVWGINLITKGRALAGTFIGAVTADAGSIGTTELADGAVTSAKIASLTVGTTDITNKAVTVGKMADLAQGSILTGQASNLPAALDLKGAGEIAIGDATDVNAHPFTGSVSLDSGGITALVKGFEDDGHPAIGYVYCTGDVVDTELVTIDGRTYEFDDDSTFSGNVQVNVTGDLTADAAMIALALAINGDASRTVDAVVMAGNNDTTAGVLLIAKAVGANNFSLTTDITNGGVVSAANMTLAAAAANRKMTFLEYTITAADVTLLALVGGNSVVIGGVVSGTEPILSGLVARTSAGAVKSLATVIVTMLRLNTNFWVVIVDDSGVVLANGDTLGFHLTV